MNKNIIYMIAILMIAMTSCNKESVTEEEPEIIIDPPNEIDYPVALGVVIDEYGILSDTKVLVYQEGELKGETTSNEIGEYSTIEIETTPGEDLILEFVKEDYGTSYRKRSEAALKSKSLNVEMINVDEIFGSSSSITNPDDEYISLSGYVKTYEGNPSRANIEVEYSLDNAFWSNSTVTDSEGYYELLLAKDTDLRVSIFTDPICFTYLTEEEVTIYANLKAEEMGPFSEDVILDDYINDYVTARDFELSGKVLKCDGSNSTITSVEITIDDHVGSNYQYIIDSESDGTFTLNENDCKAIPYSVTLVGKDLANNMYSDTLKIEVTNVVYTNDAIELLTCTTLDNGFSTAVMEVDGTEYTFSQINTRKENGSLVADDQTTLSTALFTIPNVVLGTNNISGLELFDWGTGAYFKAVNNVMDAEVTALSANAATVTILGDFTDVNGEMVQGSCLLNLTF